MSITLLITRASVNFLAVHDAKYLKFKVQKFESHSVYRIEEYIIQEISAFKSQFCNVFSHRDEQNALKSLEKDVILSWKSLENQSDFCTNAGDHWHHMVATNVLIDVCLYNELLWHITKCWKIILNN